MGATPEELVRKLSDLMHEFNVNGLNGDVALDAVGQFIDVLGRLIPAGAGGGGAGIDDAATAPTTTWSSERIAELLAGKAPANWISMLEVAGGSGENPVDTGMTISAALDQFFDSKAPATWSSELGDFGGTEGEPSDTGLSISKALDAFYRDTIGALSAVFGFASMSDLAALGISQRGGLLVPVLDELPANPDPGKVYVIRNADGTLGFHLLNPIAPEA